MNPHPDDVKEAERLLAEHLIQNTDIGMCYGCDFRMEFRDAIALALTARRAKEGCVIDDYGHIIPGKWRTISLACEDHHVFVPSESALVLFRRGRAYDLAREAALSARGKEQGAKDGK